MSRKESSASFSNFYLSEMKDSDLTINEAISIIKEYNQI